MIQKSVAALPEAGSANVHYELELRERIVRVEEELKHQRELMIQGFELMEKRFEQVEKRFKQFDKRFEQMERHITEIIRRLDRFMFWSLGLTVSAVFVVVKLTG